MILTEIHDNHALVDIDLTGHANAGRRIHGLEHVIDKLLNFASIMTTALRACAVAGRETQE